MATHQLEDIAGFIERYRTFAQEYDQTRFERFQADFERLRPGMVNLQAAAAAERRSTASTFNIFHLLGVAYDEVRTHSAILADLLNPRGHHAQGALFLEGFLDHCTQLFPDLPIPQFPLHSQAWSVQTERVTALGNLDLVLASPRRYLYVIENKLGAPDQDQQMARYAQWLEQHTQYPHRALFYLTPDGRESSSANGASYNQISYRDDIVPWLKEALEKVEAPRLVQTLTQYMEVLKTL